MAEGHGNNAGFGTSKSGPLAGCFSTIAVGIVITGLSLFAAERLLTRRGRVSLAPDKEGLPPGRLIETTAGKPGQRERM